MLKRAGRGHDPAGVGATAPGELAIECPACPHPGSVAGARRTASRLTKRRLFFVSTRFHEVDRLKAAVSAQSRLQVSSNHF